MEEIRSSLAILADVAIDEEERKTKIKNEIRDLLRPFPEIVIQDSLDDLNGEPPPKRIKTWLIGLSRDEQIKLLKSVKDYYIALENS